MKASGVCGVLIRAPCYRDALYWCLHEFWECQRCSVSTTVPCLHEARLCDLQYMRWCAPTGRVIGNWSVLPFGFRDFHLAPSKVAEKTKWRPILRHEPPGKGAGWLSALKTPQKSPWDKTDWTLFLYFSSSNQTAQRWSVSTFQDILVSSDMSSLRYNVTMHLAVLAWLWGSLRHKIEKDWGPP